MRLQRALARAGVASRRKAEDLIRAGHVRVNGAVAAIGQSVDTAVDEITVSGRRVRAGQPVWIALHKPVGYVVTRRDPRGRPTVFDLVPAVPGLTYVGRLDIMSSGLVLFTNDGGVANRLLHPRYAVERTYRVRVRGRPVAAIREALAKPIFIDGRPVRLVRWSARARGEVCDVDLVLAEGRYRIVRRLCAQLGLRIDWLQRRAHGPIALGHLRLGTWRYLTRRERSQLAALFPE